MKTECEALEVESNEMADGQICQLFWQVLKDEGDLVTEEHYPFSKTGMCLLQNTSAIKMASQP